MPSPSARLSKQLLTTKPLTAISRPRKSLLRKWTTFCLPAAICFGFGSAFAEVPTPVAPASEVSSAPAVSASSSATYWLFNPTPENALRDLNTDRPDVTESPFTVDAGHVQLEMSFVDFSTARADAVRTNQWQIAPLNLRLGVLDNLELGVFLNPWTQQTARAAGGTSKTVAGFSDTTLRVKYNLMGNDGKGLALGLIFDATIPTAARALGNGGHAGYDVILPLAFEFHGFGVSVMTEGDLVWNVDRASYRAAWMNSFSIEHEIVKSVSIYGEITSYTSVDPQAITLDTGVTWQLGKNTQFDAGGNFGVTREAPDYELFTGISQRF